MITSNGLVGGLVVGAIVAGGVAERLTRASERLPKSDMDILDHRHSKVGDNVALGAAGAFAGGMLVGFLGASGNAKWMASAGGALAFGGAAALIGMGISDQF